MARVPFELPHDYRACEDGKLGTIVLHENKPHKTGTLMMQFVIGDVTKLNPIFSQELPLTTLFAAIPDDLNVKAPKEGPNVVYKTHKNTYIGRHIRPPTDARPMNYTLIHEAQMLTELERKMTEPLANIWKFKGFVTAKFDEIPASAKQDRIVGIAVTPGCYMSLALHAAQWSNGDPNWHLNGNDQKKLKKDIRKALDKIHAAGYAHNDIAPENIGFDASGNGVLMNFHACAKIGERLDPAYIYPWGIVEWYGHYDGYNPTSSKEMDDYFFGMLFDWVDRTFDMDIHVARAA